MEEKLQELQRIVDRSDNIVFFGGAGVSTDSGIPDYRSPGTGIYNRPQEEGLPSAEVLSRAFLTGQPEEFFRLYRGRGGLFAAQPNAAHAKLAQMEASGKLRAVVTQNIDGLHQKAGSRQVFELHGSIWRNYCDACGRRYGSEAVRETTGVPRCGCGGMVRPNVVLFGESLDEETVAGAVQAIRAAGVLIVGGTSLSVYPAAGMLRYFTGQHLVIINRMATPQDDAADLVIHAGIAETLGALR